MSMYGDNKYDEDDSDASTTDSSDSDCEPDSASDEDDLEYQCVCDKGHKQPCSCKVGLNVSMGGDVCVPLDYFLQNKLYNHKRKQTKNKKQKKSKNKHQRHHGVRRSLRKNRFFFGVSPRKEKLESLFANSENIIELTDHTFPTYKNKVVLFYAPWCGHCQEFKDTYKKIAKSVSSSYPLYVMDCTDEENCVAIPKKYNIEGYPTILFVKEDGTSVPFEENRNEDNVLSWIQRMYGGNEPIHSGNSPSSLFANSTNIIELNDTIFTNYDKKVVLFYAPWCGYCKAFEPTYKEVAEKLNGNQVLYTMDCTDEKCKKMSNQYGIRGFPTVLYIKDKYSKPIQYDGNRTKEDLLQWIGSVGNNTTVVKPKGFFSSDAIIELTSNNIIGNDAIPNPKIVLFYSPDCHFCHDFEPVYSNVANSLLPHTLLYAMDATKEENAEICEMYHIEGYPTLLCMMATPVVGKRVNHSNVFNDSRTEKKVRKWIESQLQKTSMENVKRKKKYKSYSGVKDSSSEVKDGTVEIIENIIELHDTTAAPKTGPMLFYAPWCGHCTHTKPAYCEVAKKKKEITFYMVNGDSADGNKAKKLKEKYKIKGFPSIFWVEDGERKEGCDFTKQRDEAHIMEWVEENSKKHV